MAEKLDFTIETLGTCKFDSPIKLSNVFGDHKANYVKDDSYVRNTINVFQPEYIIIGGGPSAQKDKLLDPIMKELATEVYGGSTRTKVVIAKLGNDAGVIGAAMLGKIS